jgi:hypothetical protein
MRQIGYRVTVVKSIIDFYGEADIFEDQITTDFFDADPRIARAQALEHVAQTRASIQPIPWHAYITLTLVLAWGDGEQKELRLAQGWNHNRYGAAAEQDLAREVELYRQYYPDLPADLPSPAW